MDTRIAANRQPLTLVEDAKTKASRQQLLADIRAALASLTLTYEVEDEANEMTIIIRGQHISADVWFQKNLPIDMTMISWFTSGRQLAPLASVWDEKAINPCHRRKSSSYPQTFRQLIRMLVIGFAADANGSAYLDGSLDQAA